MPEQRIVLANGSRLVREMLNRILLKTDNLKVVNVISGNETLPLAIEQEAVDWVVMSLPGNGLLPEWVDPYMNRHPEVHFMAVANDGSSVRTKWLENHEENLDNLSLSELIQILGNA
jgi:DNA-binding NarL/FixJ family response regulator